MPQLDLARRQRQSSSTQAALHPDAWDKAMRSRPSQMTSGRFDEMPTPSVENDRYREGGATVSVTPTQ